MGIDEQTIRQIGLALAGFSSGLWIYVAIFMASHAMKVEGLSRKRFFGIGWAAANLAFFGIIVTIARITRYAADGPILTLEWFGNLAFLSSLAAGLFLIHVIRESSE